MGEPDWVFADLRRMNPVIAGEDAGFIVFGHADGRRALFDGNRHLDHAAENHRLTLGECLVEGTKGAIELCGDGSLHLRKFGETGQRVILAPRDWPGFAGDCVFALQQHVVCALAGDGAIENLARDYLRVLEIEDAIYRSAESGRRTEV